MSNNTNKLHLLGVKLDTLLTQRLANLYSTTAGAPYVCRSLQFFPMNWISRRSEPA